MKTNRLLIMAAASMMIAGPELAMAHTIKSDINPDTPATFDITHAEASAASHLLTFRMDVAGTVGSTKPEVTGKLPGAGVTSYVWPTSINPAKVGFDSDSGILALAVTAHPDFDDTPLYDENADGDTNNDGADWHSHWVVLTKDSACGAGLKVRDISPGTDLLPGTAPGLAIALDSPGMSPQLAAQVIEITVPVTQPGDVQFDAVTAELKVNANGVAPLLCVSVVHDIASGDLSLPGKVMPKK